MLQAFGGGGGQSGSLVKGFRVGEDMATDAAI